MSLLIFFIVFYILLSVSLYFLFPKLNKEASKGLIPGVNFAECCEAIGRPRWWAWMLLIPIVNFFIYAGIFIHLVRSFGKMSFLDSFLAVVATPFILYQIAKSNDYKYLEPNFLKEKEYNEAIAAAKKDKNEREYNKLIAKNPYKKSGFREWIESVVFAVFAAAFIRMFLIEAFVIPTPSMEKSLLVGDYLFVSKASYGIRTPMTVAMVPLLHNRLPIIQGESYLKKPSLPYFRLPALKDVKMNDPIVFNWPAGDSIYLTKQRSYAIDQVQYNQFSYLFDPELKSLERDNDYIVRPIDKKDHYIKRCVGLPGDEIQIKNKQVFVNGQAAENPEMVQFQYLVYPSTPISNRQLERAEITVNKREDKLIELVATNEEIEKLKSIDPNLIAFTYIRKYIDGRTVNQNEVKSLNLNPGQFNQYNTKVGTLFEFKLSQANIDSLSNNPTLRDKILGPGDDDLYPHAPQYFKGWTVDNYGPVVIPKEGATTQLTPENLAMYRRVIQVYENNDLKSNNGQIMINGAPADSYTFKQNYYWAMGDNRHNSEDSRAWGFVPHDHLVGTPLVIWFSKEQGKGFLKGIRWNRIFKSPNVN